MIGLHRNSPPLTRPLGKVTVQGISLSRHRGSILPLSKSQQPRRQLFRHVPGSAVARIVVTVSVLVMVSAAGCTHGTSRPTQPAASSPTLLPSSPPDAAQCAGTVLDHRDIQSPNLGAVRVFLVQRPGFDPSTGCVAAVTGSGRALATIDVDIYHNDLHFANPATDATGNTFVIYNPGRYDGVLVLVPSKDGFEDIGWRDPTDHYSGGRLAYYNARLDGPGEDGRYAIVQSGNSCNPDCASGSVSKVTLRWNGHEYLPAG